MSFVSFDNFQLSLCVIYAILFIYLMVDIVALLQSGHKKASFRMGFVCLLSVWTLNRTVFWFICSVDTFADLLWEKILFWTPLPIQCATFSFLLLYYSKVITRDWESSKSCFLCCYVLTNTSLMIWTLVWAFLTSIGPEKDDEWTERVWLGAQTVVFLVLTLCYARAALVLYEENYQSAKQLPIRNAHVVNGTIMICFFSRFAMDFMQSIFYNGSWRDTCCTLSFDTSDDLHLVTLLLYTVWEFVPTVVTMMFVANATGQFGLIRLLRRKAAPNTTYVYDHETSDYVDVNITIDESNPDAVLYDGYRSDSDASVLNALDREVHSDSDDSLF